MDAKSVRLRANRLEMRKVLREPLLLLLIIAVILFLFVFIIYPLMSILRLSFISGERITLDIYMRMFQNRPFINAFRNTMVLGVTVGILSVSLGFLFAYAHCYINTRFKKLFKVISIIPMVSPPFVLALSAIMLFGQFGLITRGIFGIRDFNIYGFRGVALVQTLTLFPIAYLMLVGLLDKIDPSLEEAARNMGASRWKTFRTITLPLMVPGLINAFLIVFIEVLADFTNPMILGGNFHTLATMIYIQAIANFNISAGASIAVILLFISISLFAFENFYLKNLSFITVTGKSSKVRERINERHIVWPIETVCLLITLFVIMFYALIPLGGFLRLMGINNTFTLDHFRFVFQLGQRAIRDHTTLAAIATPLTGVLAMIIAFLVARRKFIGKKFIEFTSILAMAVPGTVIGLGFVSAFNTRPLLLTGTSAIIIIVFIVRSLPVGVRSGITALRQIDPALEEAAQDMGASSGKVLRSVTIPLIAPAFFSGLVYTFVRSMTAVSAVIFLVTPRTQLITASIFAQVEQGRFGVASAYSTLLMCMVLAAILIMNGLLSKFMRKH